MRNMSGLVEALVSPKIDTKAQNKEEDDEEEKQKNTTGGKENSSMMLKNDNELELGLNVCLFNPPDKDKGGKKALRRKQVILERLVIPVFADRRKVDNVQMVGISIVCPGRPEIELSQPFISSPKEYLFTLKEGTKYRLNFSFVVSDRLVSGLKYENTLWKAGIRVDRCTVMLGTYTPREKPYVFRLEEETLPTGILVRGMYSARTKVMDQEGNCYMDIQYYFNISKAWPSIS